MISHNKDQSGYEVLVLRQTAKFSTDRHKNGGRPLEWKGTDEKEVSEQGGEAKGLPQTCCIIFLKILMGGQE